MKIKFEKMQDAFKFVNVIGGYDVKSVEGGYTVSLTCGLNDAELCVVKFRPMATGTIELIADED